MLYECLKLCSTLSTFSKNLGWDFLKKYRLSNTSPRVLLQFGLLPPVSHWNAHKAVSRQSFKHPIAYFIGTSYLMMRCECITLNSVFWKSQVVPDIVFFSVPANSVSGEWVLSTQNNTCEGALIFLAWLFLVSTAPPLFNYRLGLLFCFVHWYWLSITRKRLAERSTGRSENSGGL